MPPLGRLYDMPLYMDACFPWGEFVRLAAPVVGEFCSHGREAKGP